MRFSRLAAAVLALALSGAPRLLSDFHARGEHRGARRCQCPRTGGAHECACPTCRRAELARVADVDKMPPCHRGLARHESAQEAGHKRGLSGPCLTGSCGTPEERISPPSGTDVFTLPAPLRIASFEVGQRISTERFSRHEGSREPEIPPPRSA